MKQINIKASTVFSLAVFSKVKNQKLAESWFLLAEGHSDNCFTKYKKPKALVKSNPSAFYLCSFAVFSVEISILLISRQSSSKELPSLSVMYSDKIKSLNQYSVSAVSLRDI